MKTRRFDILVVGEINPDLILSGNVTPAFGQVEKLVDDAALTVGSSAAIFACGVARLGLKVAFIGKVGADLFGDFMRNTLEQRGVATCGIIIDPGVHTGLSVILNRGNDRAILTYPGAIPSLRLAEIDQTLLAQSRHLHLTSYFLQDALRGDVPALFDLAHQAGTSVSLDTNFDPQERWDSNLAQALHRSDIFLPNAAECCAIAGTPDLDLAIQQLAGQVSILAVKLGTQGAVLRQGDTIIRAEAIPVDVVDTIGAGDSFDAGFLFGYLSGWELERALHLAVACGSLSTRQAGGIAAQPQLQEALSYIQ